MPLAGPMLSDMRTSSRTAGNTTLAPPQYVVAASSVSCLSRHIEREFGELWEEVSAVQMPALKPSSLPIPVSVRSSLDIDPVKTVCRCSRCRAGDVAVSDMGPMDRILARHLLRMAPANRERWIEDWAANRNHAVTGKQALLTWIAIEQRERRPEPVYFARKALW